VLAVAVVWMARRQVERGRRGRWPALLILLVMAGGQCLYAWADATYYRPVTRALAVIPWAQPLTAKSFFEKHGIAKPEDQTMRLDRPGEGSFNYPKDDFVCQAEKPKNLLFILVDSLRADVLNPEVMPASAALADRGWRFDRHYSTANATRFGVFGLFYGIDGSYWFPALAEQRGPALISAMVDNEYRFGLFTSASKVSPEFDRTVYAPIRDRIDLERTPGDSKAERDLAVTRQWRDFIAEQSGEAPFMSLLFYDAPHGYDYPEGFELKFTPQLDSVSYMALDEDTDPEPFFNRYRNSAHFVDQQIAEALEALEQSGRAEDTVVVITSDHGQEFNDSGDNTWGHNSSYSSWQTKVPMVIYHPDREARVFDHLSSHIDVPPTLMRDVLGCTPPLSSYTQGRYLDSGEDHELLTFTSWSRDALFDGHKTTVFMPHDDPAVYDANYRKLDDEAADAGDIVKAMELRSEFLR
ncbi:MAG: sulfatase-like hydrolase/transferase, partial [Pseudomonadota bacterium]